MSSKTCWRYALACPVALLMLAGATPARADFFDDLRRTFQTDIPHFFQDDIPCAFGGQPTSHTKASCNSSDHTAKRGAEKAASPPEPSKPRDDPSAPANPGR